MKRASRRQQPEMNTLWFTTGITAANPESNRWLPAEVCESE